MTETRRAAAQDGQMQTRTRKAIGCFVLLAYMAVYAIAAATLGAMLMPMLPWWAELIFYAVAGIIWIFPLRPLFFWMNRSS
ncbi:MAG: DUF2842 domain-containing protein [Hyphomonadaceae bacterium]